MYVYICTYVRMTALCVYVCTYTVYKFLYLYMYVCMTMYYE